MTKGIAMIMEEKPIRILIADDHEIVREGLIALLKRQQMQVVAVAANGLEAIANYREYLPDITLMDLSMPQMNGFTAIEAILEEFPAACIIVMTTFSGELENSLRSGAKAMILKDAPRAEMLQTIRAVYREANAVQRGSGLSIP